MARACHMSISEWVRRALQFACRREPTGRSDKKLDAIRAAAKYEHPVCDIDGMLADIERGYGMGSQPGTPWNRAGLDL